jgi:hypothetical protein
MNSLSTSANWPEAMATVTECKYDFGAGRALAFGVPTSKHFRIKYNYWATDAEGEEVLHTAEYSSEKAVPQGHLFKVRYNPEAPHENAHEGAPAGGGGGRNPLIAVGIVGSVVLSMVWLLMLRGCY